MNANRALLALLLTGVLAPAEELRGVLYGYELGNGAKPSGTFQLGVGATIRNFAYPGALWKQGTMPRDWSGMEGRSERGRVTRVTCTGQIADSIRGAFALVRDYMEGWPSDISASSTLSARYRSSPELKRFDGQVNSGDLGFFFSSGSAGACLRITSVGPSVTRIASNCRVEVKGRRGASHSSS